MATRNLIMVVDRKHSSKYPEGFAIHPDLVNKHSYVNMYMHHDGYPQWQGVQIANWLLAGNNACQDGSRLASKLVHDMYYDSCYLFSNADNIDHQYRYIIWTGDKDKIHVSCWNMYNSKCVLSGKLNATPRYFYSPVNWILKLDKKIDHDAFMY